MNRNRRPAYRYINGQTALARRQRAESIRAMILIWPPVLAFVAVVAFAIGHGATL